MSIVTPSLNKRTVLGGQFWLVGAIGALTLGGVPLATPIVALGVHLVVNPALSWEDDKPSKFLLSAE